MSRQILLLPSRAAFTDRLLGVDHAPLGNSPCRVQPTGQGMTNVLVAAYRHAISVTAPATPGGRSQKSYDRIPFPLYHFQTRACRNHQPSCYFGPEDL